MQRLKSILWMQLSILLCLGSFLAATEPILDDSFQVKKVVSGCEFTEGPIVDKQNNLYFSDGPNDRIMKLAPNGKLSVLMKPFGAANGLLFDLKGRILMCQSSRPGGKRALAMVDDQGSIKTLVATFNQKKLIAPNDLCIDSKGRIYFTDPFYEGEKSQPTSGVYRYDPDGSLHLLLKHLKKPNGILISNDDKRVYISDRGTQKLHQYDLTPDGKLVNEGTLYNFAPDRGIDGMWNDVKGNIYGAAGEGKTTGLFVISPKGKLLLHKPMPEFATNVTFGGNDMKDLYITATTSVYKMRTTTAGVKHRYLRRDAK